MRSQRGVGGGLIGRKSMQNRTFLVLLRPIFAEKMKTAPPPPPRRDLSAEIVKELPLFPISISDFDL